MAALLFKCPSSLDKRRLSPSAPHILHVRISWCTVIALNVQREGKKKDPRHATEIDYLTVSELSALHVSRSRSPDQSRQRRLPNCSKHNTEEHKPHLNCANSDFNPAKESDDINKSFSSTGSYFPRCVWSFLASLMSVLLSFCRFCIDITDIISTQR